MNPYFVNQLTLPESAVYSTQHSIVRQSAILNDNPRGLREAVRKHIFQSINGHFGGEAFMLIPDTINTEIGTFAIKRSPFKRAIN